MGVGLLGRKDVLEQLDVDGEKRQIGSILPPAFTRTRVRARLRVHSAVRYCRPYPHSRYSATPCAPLPSGSELRSASGTSETPTPTAAPDTRALTPASSVPLRCSALCRVQAHTHRPGAAQ